MCIFNRKIYTEGNINKHMAARRLLLGFPEMLYKQTRLETSQAANPSCKLEAENLEKASRHITGTCR